MMKLARVPTIPTTAQKEDAPYDLANGAKGQSYRDIDGTRYEQVTINNGEIKKFRLCPN